QPSSLRPSIQSPTSHLSPAFLSSSATSFQSRLCTADRSSQHSFQHFVKPGKPMKTLQLSFVLTITLLLSARAPAPHPLSSLINPKTKEVKPADTGITKPNGINISPDNKTLLVSDYGGLNVWTFTIKDDGTLTDKKPAMTMKVGPPPAKPDVAGGDGMTVDTAGRAYVTTLLGVQIFSPDGTHLGTLPKPDGVKTLVSAGFAGKDREYLYIMCGDKIYRRK